MSNVNIPGGELLCTNLAVMKETFSWEGNAMRLCCAQMATLQNQTLRSARLKEQLGHLKEELGAFSAFRGTLEKSIVTMLTLSDSPRVLLADGRKIYEQIRKGLFSTAYLPLAAMVIAEHVPTENQKIMTDKAMDLYKRIKKNHPFLTSEEDMPFCAMMALSDRTPEDLEQDGEACYRLLKKKFHTGNMVQAFSHVLALSPQTPEVKCARAIALWDGLRQAKCSLGSDFELPVLGIMADLPRETDEIVQAVVSMDEWLRQRKEFGFWSGISSYQRRMHACLLVLQQYRLDDTGVMVVWQSSLAAVIAQEMAMLAVMTTVMAANTSSTNT